MLHFYNEKDPDKIFEGMTELQSIYLLGKEDVGVLTEAARRHKCSMSLSYERDCNRYMMYFVETGNFDSGNFFENHKAVLVPAAPVEYYDDVIDLSKEWV